MTIFIVTGTTGEYADVTNWNVKAFTDEQKANEFRDQLNFIAGHYEQSCGYGNRALLQRVLEELKALDPRASMDYNGTSYHAEPIELDE